MGFQEILEAPTFAEWFRGTARALAFAQVDPVCTSRCWCGDQVERVEVDEVERFEFEADGGMPEWALDRVAIEMVSGGAAQ